MVDMNAAIDRTQAALTTSWKSSMVNCGKPRLMRSCLLVSINERNLHGNTWQPGLEQYQARHPITITQLQWGYLVPPILKTDREALQQS